MIKAVASQLFVLICVFFLTVFSNAQSCPSPGCLDATFGNDGKNITYLAVTSSANPARVALQNDGKILALVNVLPGSSITDAIIRYNSDGTQDSTFGNMGIVELNWLTPNNPPGHAYELALQTVGAEQRIVVAGSSTGYSSSLRVERYLPNGALDTSFGTAGTVNMSTGAAEAMAIQPDGKIVTMGTYGGLVRLTANGSPDNSFGSGGAVRNPTWRVQAIALQADGRIVAAGFWTDVHGAILMSVWRFNTDGSLDDGRRTDLTKNDSFGKSGQTIIDSFNTAWDIKIDGNGKLLVAGSIGSGATDFAIARLTTSGLLDTTFGQGGKVTVDFNGAIDTAYSISIRSNGQIVLSGQTVPPSNRNTGLARLNSNGSLDTSFGQGGKSSADFSSDVEWIGNAILLVDPICNCEKVVVLGTAKINETTNAVVSRYLM